MNTNTICEIQLPHDNSYLRIEVINGLYSVEWLSQDRGECVIECMSHSIYGAYEQFGKILARIAKNCQKRKR